MRLMLALCLLAAATPLFAQAYAGRPEVQTFIDELAKRHGFKPAELHRLFSKVQRVDPALKLILPGEPISWADYRAQFVNETRIANGLAFWKDNRRSLARAEKKYGVPAQTIVAIIGVETNYGRNMGRYRVIDALSTLAFDYPPRASFFRRELEQYLLLAREEGIDVFATRGSYAGAIGMAQFMPGSLRAYAVDFNGDGRIDLSGSSADAVGSVANFLKQHGWQAGEPVLLKAKPSPDALARYMDGSFEPRHRIEELIAAGLEVDPVPPPGMLGTLVPLGAEYRVGLRNFYVITRYNRSALYAGAVNDLGEALAERRPGP
ncbi:MAG TPA: lytic murein transglycosylase B [Burkholderiales bacterium]|nr:lytic murein transglycosylase B [Burkholderiales bacterium]